MNQDLNESYLEQVSKYRAEKEMANKIFINMQRLNDFFEDSRKRWIWELVQNAQDVSGPNGISIEIELGQNQLVFRHNGLPFSIEQVVYLIEQTSSKERILNNSQNFVNRQANKTTGKYGTGFFTTHLLNKVVKIDSVFKQEIKGEDFYRKFSIKLDRSGFSKNEILEKIKNSKRQFSGHLDQISNPVLANYIPGKNMDTSFVYKIESEEAMKTVEMGLEVFNSTIGYVLLFNPSIKQIEIVRNSERQLFKKRSWDAFKKGKIFEIAMNKKKQNFYAQILDSLIIAIELERLDKTFSVTKKNSNVPCVFVNFPLISNQPSLDLPFVVHSPDFEPNEQRSAIHFELGDFSKQNKKLMESALKLFQSAYFDLEEFPNLHNISLINVKNNEFKNWLEVCLKPIRKIIWDYLKVKTNTERLISIKYVKIVHYKDAKTSFELAEIMNPLFKNFTPLLEKPYFFDCSKIIEECGKDISGSKILQIDSYFQTIQYVKNLTALSNFTENENKALKLLNNFYGITKNEPTLENFEVLPNQNGKFCKKSELARDIEIPEILKTICSRLGKDFKEILLHKQINFELGKSLSIPNISSFINYNLKEIHKTEIIALSHILPTQKDFFSDYDKYHDIIKGIFDRKFVTLENWEESIWAKSKEFLPQIIFEKIEACENLSNFNSEFNKVDNLLKKVISFFDPFSKSRKIFPNLKGRFLKLEQLFVFDLEKALEPKYGLHANQIKTRLFEIGESIGLDLKSKVIDDSFIEFATNQNNYKIEVFISQVNNFLSDRNNYKKDFFKKIFEELIHLEEKYGFDEFFAFAENKQAMFYDLIEPGKKKILLENSQKKDFFEVNELIKNKSAIQIKEAFDFQEKFKANLSQIAFSKLQNLDSNELDKLNLIAKLDQQTLLKIKELFDRGELKTHLEHQNFNIYGGLNNRTYENTDFLRKRKRPIFENNDETSLSEKRRNKKIKKRNNRKNQVKILPKKKNYKKKYRTVPFLQKAWEIKLSEAAISFLRDKKKFIMFLKATSTNTIPTLFPTFFI